MCSLFQTQNIRVCKYLRKSWPNGFMSVTTSSFMLWMYKNQFLKMKSMVYYAWMLLLSTSCCWKKTLQLNYFLSVYNASIWIVDNWNIEKEKRRLFSWSILATEKYQDFRLTEGKVTLFEGPIINFECIINIFSISLLFYWLICLQRNSYFLWITC